MFVRTFIVEYYRSGQIGLSGLKRKITAPLPRYKPDPVIIPTVTKSKFLLVSSDLLLTYF